MAITNLQAEIEQICKELSITHHEACDLLYLDQQGELCATLNRIADTLGDGLKAQEKSDAERKVMFAALCNAMGFEARLTLAMPTEQEQDVTPTSHVEPSPKAAPQPWRGGEQKIS